MGSGVRRGGLLTIGAIGPAVVEATTHVRFGNAGKAVVPALVIMAMIYAVSDVSGAHLNPAVTLAFSMRSDFPWARLPGY